MSENQTGNTPAGAVLHVDPTVGDGMVAIPGGDMLLVADYVREGSDLILVGPEGQTVVVDNYFSMANPPALTTAGGARVPGDLVQKLAGPVAPGQYAQSGDEQGEPIGQVETVDGAGQIVRADGTSEVLEAGVPIYQGDTLVTADGSTAGVIFADKTTLSIGEDARMVIDEMVYDPAVQEGSQLFSLMQGAFVITSGEIGKLNPEDVTVRTPTTTIGIRGTKYGVSVDQEGGGTMITVLEGTVIVANDAGTIELNTVGQSTRAAGYDAAPEAAFSLGASQMNDVYGLVLKAHPTQPPLEVNVDSQENQQGQEPEAEQQNEEDLEKLAEALDGVDTAAGGEAGEGEGDAEQTEEEMEQLAEQLEETER